MKFDRLFNNSYGAARRSRTDNVSHASPAGSISSTTCIIVCLYASTHFYKNTSVVNKVFQTIASSAIFNNASHTLSLC